MVQGASVQADEKWTARVKRGTTAAPQPDDHSNSVRRDGGRTLSGLERLQADLLYMGVVKAPLGTGSVSCNSAFILHLCRFLNQEDLMEREAMVQNP